MPTDTVSSSSGPSKPQTLAELYSRGNYLDEQIKEYEERCRVMEDNRKKEQYLQALMQRCAEEAEGSTSTVNTGEYVRIFLHASHIYLASTYFTSVLRGSK